MFLSRPTDPVSMEKAAKPSRGDMVSWNSSGGRATGKIERIVREGSLDVPNSSFTINAEPDDPAVLIRVYRNDRPTSVIVGHKMSSLNTVAKANPYHDPKTGRFTSGPGGGGSGAAGGGSGAGGGSSIPQSAPTTNKKPYTSSDAAHNEMYGASADKFSGKAATNAAAAQQVLSDSPVGAWRDSSANLRRDFERVEKMPHKTPEQRAKKITALGNVRDRAKYDADFYANEGMLVSAVGYTAAKDFPYGDAAKAWGKAAADADNAIIALRGMR